MKRCEGCGWLVWEDWPRGMRAARCMHPEALRGPGRVVGNPWDRERGAAALVRPAWCPARELCREMEGEADADVQ